MLVVAVVAVAVAEVVGVGSSDGKSKHNLACGWNVRLTTSLKCNTLTLTEFFLRNSAPSSNVHVVFIIT